jgi:hypothetical protein
MTRILAAIVCVASVGVAQAEGPATGEDQVVETQVIRRAFDADFSRVAEVDAWRGAQLGILGLYGFMTATGCGGQSTLDQIARPLLALESFVGVSRVDPGYADDLAAMIGGVEVIVGGLLIAEARQTRQKEGNLLAPACDLIAAVGMISYGVSHGVNSDLAKQVISDASDIADDVIDRAYEMVGAERN